MGRFRKIVILLFLSVVGTYFYVTADAFALAPTITLSVDDNAVDLDVVVNSPSGSFAKSSNSTISVLTDNYTGYKLLIRASGDSTDLVKDSEHAINSIDTAVSEESFSDNSSAGEVYNGKWGYLPSKFNSVDNTNFLPSPTDTGDIIDETDSANDEANTYSIALGTRIDTETEPGTYSNTFVIYAIANLINYSITFNSNTSDTVTGMPEPSTLTGSVDQTMPTISLPYETPFREDYIFKGWCKSYVADNESCTGAVYSPGEPYEFDFTGYNVFTLYAWWGLEPLYNKVAAMSKGLLTSTIYSAVPYVPTSTIPSEDTTASGVYQYASDAFGVDSDGYNSSGEKMPIYIYRGILDTSAYNHGSNGMADAYPNYVKLGEKEDATCWRIIRTTGSGGVKMIYNGNYNSYDGCANGTYTTSTSNWSGTNANTHARQIARLGYTYNNSYSSTTSSTSTDSVFGSNNDYSVVNTTVPPIKTAVDNWVNSNLSDYLEMLETNAGFCNDRSVYSSTAYSYSPQITSVVPYLASGTESVQFGSVSVHPNTLGCTRGIVDIYSSEVGDGGNGQLDVPAALITVNEARLAGLNTTNRQMYALNYLNNDGIFWTMSPVKRSLIATISPTAIDTTGGSIISQNPVRPVISLVEGTVANSGSGTAIDPWVVISSGSSESDVVYMQDVTSGMVTSMGEGKTATYTDHRDGQKYSVVKYRNYLWMTRNLAIGCNGYGDVYNSNITSVSLNPSNTNIPFDYSTTTVDLKNVTSSSIPALHCSRDYGAWYNFAAATAGIVTDLYSTASYDICPAGWSLPNPNNNPVPFSSVVFQPTAGGLWPAGESNAVNDLMGFWWTQVASSSGRLAYMYNSSEDSFGSSGNSVGAGLYIRCVKSGT